MCFRFSEYFINKLSIICQTISDRLVFDYSGIPTQVPLLLSYFGLTTESNTSEVIKDCPLETFPLDASITDQRLQRQLFAPLNCRLANLPFTEGTFPELFKVGLITLLNK